LLKETIATCLNQLIVGGGWQAKEST
jgi:hypothetical protein